MRKLALISGVFVLPCLAAAQEDLRDPSTRQAPALELQWDEDFSDHLGWSHNSPYAGNLVFISNVAGDYVLRIADQSATFTPTTSPAPANTGSLSVVTPIDNDLDQSNTGINAFWGSDLAGSPAQSAVLVEGGDLLLIRWHIRDPLQIPANIQEGIRFRYGNGAALGAGTVMDALIGPNQFYHLEAPRIHNSWFYAATDETRFRLFVEALDLSDTGQSAFELSRVDIYRTTRSSVEEEVIYNQGDASVAGAPNDLLTVFDLDTTDGTGWRYTSFFTGRPMTNTGTSSNQLVLNSTAALERFNFGRWDTNSSSGSIPVGQPLQNAINDVTANDLLFLDFYLSAPNGNTLTPVVRVGLEGIPLTQFGPHPRLAAYHIFSTQTAPHVARPLAATPKPYTLVYQPALHDPATGLLTTDLFDAILVFDAMLFDRDFDDRGTVRLNRVVVSKAPVPSLD